MILNNITCPYCGVTSEQANVEDIEFRPTKYPNLQELLFLVECSDEECEKKFFVVTLQESKGHYIRKPTKEEKIC